MSIKRTIITTATIVVAVAMVASVAGAQTPTVAQLMAEIQQLTAQLTQLQGNSGSQGTGTGACAGISFSRNLTVGATGSDVKCLQVILNQSASTKVSATGAGSPGMETTTFGPKTLAAVKKYQAANGLTPANQVGPKTIQLLNAAIGGVVIVPGQPPVITPTGSISAMTALDTPASGAVVVGQATADLLHINFTGTGTVTSVTLQRSGISDQNTLSNVYLYDGNVRITDGYSFNVNGQIVINGLSIAVSGSHEISVKADVYNYAGQTLNASTIAVGLTGFEANGSTLTSSAMGNTMSIVQGNLATVTLPTSGTLNNVTGSPTINAGTTSYTVWSAPIQVNVRAVEMKTANFKMIGSAPSNALANIKLFVDGVDTGKIATVGIINGSSYAMFDFTAAPLPLGTGSHTIDVRADIVGGASRTVQVSVQQASDLTITDPQVGVNIAVGGTPNSAAQITINQGSATVNVDPTFSTQTNIAGGATGAVIGRFAIQGYGEDVKITSIKVTPQITGACTTGTTYMDAGVGGTIDIGNSAVTQVENGNCTTTSSSGVGLGYSAGNGLQNVTLYFNGSQVGSQVNWVSGSGAITFNLGSQAIAPAGQVSELEVRANLQTAGSIAYTAGTVVATLNAGSYNAQGQSSQTTFAVPTVDVPTNGLTIEGGLLQVSQNPAYVGQSIPPSTTGVRIGSYVVSNTGTSESINLTSLIVGLTVGSGGNTWNGGAGCPGQTVPPQYSTTTGLSCYSGASTITDISALRTSDTTGSGSIPVQPAANNTFSINDTLAPGAQMVIDIFATTGSIVPTNVQTTLQVTSIGVTSHVSATTPTNPVNGQAMTLGTGALATPALFSSSTTPAQYIATGATGAANSSQATFNFVASSGAVNINELKFLVTSSPVLAGTVTTVKIGSGSCGDAGTVCATPQNGIADLNFTTPLAVLNNGGLPVNVQMSYAGVGTSGLTPTSTSKISLVYAKYASGGATVIACPDTVTLADGSTLACTNTDTNDVLNSSVIASETTPMLTLVGSVPTVTVPSTVATGLNPGSSGAQQIGQVTVAANNAGQIRVRQIIFSIGSSGFDAGNKMLLGGANGYDVTYLAVNGSKVNDVYCIPTNVNTAESSNTITCSFTSNGAAPTNNVGYNSDYPITGGGSTTFNLFTTVGGGNTGTGKANVSSSVTAAGFKWDDSSTNGASGTGLDGQLISNFPTGSYEISQ